MTKFLTPHQVADRFGYKHHRSVVRLSKQGKLPPMVEIGPNRKVFIEDEIEAVAQEKIAARDAQVIGAAE